MRTGALFVFEGPDGAGKTTIATGIAKHLRDTATPVTLLAFPGREPGSFGKHVYDIHHTPEAFGIAHMTPASRQLLHIAAHVDAIQSTIIRRVTSGEVVLLDRFWWSTWVYGTADGIAPTLLDAMIHCERLCWGALTPSALFLITRVDSLRPADAGIAWRRRAELYATLASRERYHYPIHTIPNDGTSIECITRILKVITSLIGPST